MTLSLRYTLVILTCVVFSVQADVSHLGYKSYNGNRVASLRLQRLESQQPTPYPLAGYRPNREFNLPQEQPLFPLSNQQVNTQQQASSGFDNLSESQQKPQLVYGAPAQRFPQQTLSQRPQASNDFNNLAETQQQTAFNRAEKNEFGGGHGFNMLAEPQQQQQPKLLYAAPNSQEQQSHDFENLAEQQKRSQYNYNSPARLRQLLIARLQQAQSQTQPQTLYSAPAQQQQEVPTQNQAEAETQPSRLTAAKPERLTDDREEREEETADSALDIETTTKKDTPQNTTNGTTLAVAPVPVAPNGVVNYYPATAFSFVHPISAAYVAATNYHTVQPINAAYTIGSPFLPQQYAFTAAPAQLQAW